MSRSILRIATRKSPLALWQANFIRQQLINYWPQLQIELLPLVTAGDIFLQDKLLKVGGKGLFVKELEIALLEGRADLAVHSMKDVPATFPQGLMLAAICKRENPYDALLSKKYTTLTSLPNGATVGTSSLRRQSQLLTMRPDLQIKTLRGNIHTRINALDDNKFDAIILACAGLERMGLAGLITETFSEDKLLPACGQGALGIECRQEDNALQTLIQPLNDQITAQCVATERLVNQHLGGNCHAPIAIYCTQKTQLFLQAKVASYDGKTVLHFANNDLPQNYISLATNVAQQLLEAGAKKLIDNTYAQS